MELAQEELPPDLAAFRHSRAAAGRHMQNKSSYIMIVSRYVSIFQLDTGMLCYGKQSIRYFVKLFSVKTCIHVPCPECTEEC
jgi:hypothetical protein